MKSIALLSIASLVAAKPIEPVEPPYTPPPNSLGAVRVSLFDQPNFSGNEKWVDATLLPFDGKCVDVESSYGTQVFSASWISNTWVVAEICFFQNSACGGISKCYYSNDAKSADLGEIDNKVGSVSIVRYD